MVSNHSPSASAFAERLSDPDDDASLDDVTLERAAASIRPSWAEVQNVRPSAAPSAPLLRPPPAPRSAHGSRRADSTAPFPLSPSAEQHFGERAAEWPDGARGFQKSALRSRLLLIGGAVLAAVATFYLIRSTQSLNEASPSQTAAKSPVQAAPANTASPTNAAAANAAAAKATTPSVASDSNAAAPNSPPTTQEAAPRSTSSAQAPALAPLESAAAAQHREPPPPSRSGAARGASPARNRASVVAIKREKRAPSLAAPTKPTAPTPAPTTSTQRGGTKARKGVGFVSNNPY